MVNWTFEIKYWFQQFKCGIRWKLYRWFDKYFGIWNGVYKVDWYWLTPPYPKLIKFPKINQTFGPIDPVKFVTIQPMSFCVDVNFLLELAKEKEHHYGIGSPNGCVERMAIEPDGEAEVS